MEASGYCPSHSHHNMIARCNVQVGLVDLPVALLTMITMIFKVLKHPEFAALLAHLQGAGRCSARCCHQPEAQKGYLAQLHLQPLCAAQPQLPLHQLQ